MSEIIIAILIIILEYIISVPILIIIPYYWYQDRGKSVDDYFNWMEETFPGYVLLSIIPMVNVVLVTIFVIMLIIKKLWKLVNK